MRPIRPVPLPANTSAAAAVASAVAASSTSAPGPPPRTLLSAALQPTPSPPPALPPSATASFSSTSASPGPARSPPPVPARPTAIRKVATAVAVPLSSASYQPSTVTTQPIPLVKPRPSKRPSKSPLPVEAQPTRIRAVSATQYSAERPEEGVEAESEEPLGRDEQGFAVPRAVAKRTSNVPLQQQQAAMMSLDEVRAAALRRLSNISVDVEAEQLGTSSPGSLSGLTSP